MTSRARSGAAGCLILVLTVLLAACTTVPADPEGTLDRVRGGILRVGVSPHEPWTVIGTGSEPAGLEVDLVRAFAASQRARVDWRVGGEEALMTQLKGRELDLVVGGLTSDTPWSNHAAITRPYAEGPDPAGKVRERVMAAPMGENAFLLELERFLLAQDLR